MHPSSYFQLHNILYILDFDLAVTNKLDKSEKAESVSRGVNQTEPKHKPKRSDQEQKPL